MMGPNVDKFNYAFNKMIFDAEWYIKPTHKMYFEMSTCHDPYVWRDYHEKQLKGYILGVQQRN